LLLKGKIVFLTQGVFHLLILGTESRVPPRVSNLGALVTGSVTDRLDSKLQVLHVAGLRRARLHVGLEVFVLIR
jgi:hypothetical protein